MSLDLNEEALVRVLSNKEEIVPSSGFAASIMDAVRQEASAPAPIPFPWKWALPGFAVCVGLIIFCLVRLIAGSVRSSSSTPAGFSSERLFAMVPHPSTAPSITLGIEWGVLALLASFLIIWLSMRLAAGRE